MSIAIPIPGWIEEQRRNLAELAAGLPGTGASLPASAPSLSGIRDFIEIFDAQIVRARLMSEGDSEFPGQIWEIVISSIRILTSLRDFAAQHLQGDVGRQRWLVEAANTVLEQTIDLARTILISRTDWNLTLPDDLEEIVWTVRISPLAYLRAMANLFWSAIRHPLSETTIDLSTGRVLYRT